MTTDPITREDLLMAAKAANYLVVDGAAAFVTHRAGGLVLEDERGGSLWHPGNDDGDCARMEDAVVIDLFRISSGIYAERRDLHIAIFAKFADHANDKSRARRYASVKLAAAVGRAM